ncbi:unnamed protein product [Paramecium primaurelia]|uniref:Uncharacterized protein n=1 Tax=Paramecium primaurelia TaxID=5886 RepID=A0A8S1KS73_PARPR|nr:unnamed protein product [Paramecium primaurelia]
MDIYNILELSLYLCNYIQCIYKNQIKSNSYQKYKLQKMVKNKNYLIQKFIPNQKLTLLFKNLMQFLDKSQIEYNVYYYLDIQYVDFYIQMRNHIILVDNLLYVTYDMEIRINLNEWNQMNDDQRGKVLLM